MRPFLEVREALLEQINFEAEQGRERWGAYSSRYDSGDAEGSIRSAWDEALKNGLSADNIEATIVELWGHKEALSVLITAIYQAAISVGV